MPVAYLTAEGMEDEGGAGGAWHVLTGLLLLALFVPRRVGHRLRRLARVEGTSVANTLAAATVHPALLLFVVVQPLLGMAAIRADGDALAGPFTQMSLRAPVPMEGRGEAAVVAPRSRRQRVRRGDRAARGGRARAPVGAPHDGLHRML